LPVSNGVKRLELDSCTFKESCTSPSSCKRSTGHPLYGFGFANYPHVFCKLAHIDFEAGTCSGACVVIGTQTLSYVITTPDRKCWLVDFKAPSYHL
jgi:hypothetical protein